MVSTSCSLLHVPYDVGLEDGLPAEVVPWLAFAEQKLAEVVTPDPGHERGRGCRRRRPWRPIAP